jgi:hypothetical protein
MIYFSAEALAFYDSEIHASIPDDARAISAEQHASLLYAQEMGKCIVADNDGNPITADPHSLLNLDELKNARWLDVKQLRDQHIDGGCDVPAIGRFDTDVLSRSNINGAVTGAFMAKVAAAPFAVQWKLADNSLVELDADQMIHAGQTVLAHVSTCHGRSQALGLLIAAAATKADLEAIDIEEGWPA